MSGAGGGILEVDESSALALVAADTTLAAIDEGLRPRGLHFPVPVESRERALGSALASPRPSEATPRGRLAGRCAALQARLLDGTAIATRLAPRKATGPDLAAALIGGRGATGRITAAWMRLRRTPQQTTFCGFAFASGDEALARAQHLLALGVLPADLQLLDASLAPPALAAAIATTGIAGAVLVALQLDGARELVAAEEGVVVEEVTRGAGGGRAVAPRQVEEFLLRRRPLRLDERFVAAPALAKAWSARPAPALLAGIHHAGAALCSPAGTLPDVAPPPPAIAAVHAALAARLGAVTAKLG